MLLAMRLASSRVSDLVCAHEDLNSSEDRRAAYEDTVKRLPGRIVTLRQKMRLLAVAGEKISTSVPARTNRRQEEVTQR